jgi:dTMP kinase
MSGAFIVVDGPDGAGKTTLVSRLAARLRDRGREVLEVRQPGGTPLAEAARRAALDPVMQASPLAELFLILAARADQVAKVIRPALERGRVVLSDRYDLSTVAYQIAGRGLPRGPVMSANELATDGLRPGLTLVLDLPADVGLERQVQAGKEPDRIEGEGTAWHECIAAAFREASGPGIVHLDAAETADAVELAAWDAVESHMRETSGGGEG